MLQVSPCVARTLVVPDQYTTIQQVVNASTRRNFGGYAPNPVGLNGNISPDPQFCDASAGGYRVPSSSPRLRKITRAAAARWELAVP